MQLIERLRCWAHECDRTNSGCQAKEMLLEAADTIDRLQNEAEPVKHGRWVLKCRTHQLFDDVDEEFYVECNLCKREEYVPFEFEEQKSIDYAKQNYPYCHCGAKMDLEDNA